MSSPNPVPWANEIDAPLPQDFASAQEHVASFRAAFRSPNARRGAIVAVLGPWRSALETIHSESASVVAISGFDSAGDLHLGNLIVLQDLSFLKSRGCSIRIPIVTLEAVAARNATPQDARARALESILPTLIRLGFSDDEIYLRSEVEDILELMALVSSVLRPRDLLDVYGEALSPGQLFSSLFMIADILRPLVETPAASVIALYGIDEIAHIRLANVAAGRLGLPEVTGIFSELLPARRGKRIKMSKSLAKHYYNIPLTFSPQEVSEAISQYVIHEPCMIRCVRRVLTTDLNQRPECDLRCGECKSETSELLGRLLPFSHEPTPITR